MLGPGERLCLLGCGKMGQALLSGWRKQGLSDAALLVVDPRPDAAALELIGGATLASSLSEVAQEAVPTVLVLAVKPQFMESALGELEPAWREVPLVLSIAAGKNLDWYAGQLGAQARVVRAMPNTPAAVGAGMSSLVANAQVGTEGRVLAENLMRAVGETVWLESEAQMSAATAVAGCGPAYLFYLIEVMAAQSEALGLAPEVALKLARTTVWGAGQLAYASAEPPAILRQNVTSPGGVTAEALAVLMRENTGLEALMGEAMAAAVAKDQAL